MCAICCLPLPCDQGRSPSSATVSPWCLSADHRWYCFFRYIPERLLHARGTPRCIFLVIISALTAVVVCCNAFASLLLLFPASIMAGLAFGALWSLMATLTSELFGLHHFASNYTFVQVGFVACAYATE